MTARNRHHPDRVSQETKVTFCVQGVMAPAWVIHSWT
jgi:hypothetical protein